MVEIIDLVRAAQNRDKARIGLPPSSRDNDGEIVFVIGTATLFDINPIEFDEIFWDGEIVILPFETDQVGGVINDQMVIQITVPDLPNAADLVDEVADAASIGAVLGNWAINRKYKKAARAAFIIRLQNMRLTRARRIAVEAVKPAKQLRAARRAGRVSKSLAKRVPAQAKRIQHLKKIRVIATTVAFKLVFKAVLVVALVVDVILVSHRTARGFEDAGLAGGVGGLVGGLFDVVTFGLAEKPSEVVQATVTDALVIVHQEGLGVVGRAFGVFSRLRFL